MAEKSKNTSSSVNNQILKNGRNSIEILAALDQIVKSSESTIQVEILDELNNPVTYSFPTVGYLKSQIDRLNENINRLSSVSTNGAFILDADNSFKKIIVSDLNREPNSLSELTEINFFTKKKNWFFDSLLDPILSIELDLNGAIENNVRQVLTRRYIVKFNVDENGDPTTLGESAIVSFNQTINNRTNVGLDEFLDWHATTPGVQNPNNPICDEQFNNLEPNEVLYDGVFTVLGTEVDDINNKLWYYLDTITYNDLLAQTGRELAVGDEVIVNNDISTTRYRVREVNTDESQFKVDFERIEGFEPIPVGIGTLKIYTPIIINKTVPVSIGFNEYCVVFAKPMNTDNFLLAKDWSEGTSFYTNDLTLESNDEDNGLSMEEFYAQTVFDYGLVLKDLVAKKIPSDLGAIPNAPYLDTENFRVVQINKHLTDTVDREETRAKHNQSNTLKSEIKQIDEAISKQTRALQTRRFTSQAERQKEENQLTKLNEDRVSKNKLRTSLLEEIMAVKKNVFKAEAKFRIRGFFDMPEAVFAFNTQPQEVVQFVYEYRYLSKDGQASTIEGFTLKSRADQLESETKPTAVYSSWVQGKTDVRKRVFNEDSGYYEWQIEDVADADTPNINQLDIPISPGERVEIRVKSLSEVGWPDSPVESEWSDTITIDFPDDLNNVLGEDDFILEEATQEEQRVRFEQDLNSRGLGKHLEEQIITEDKFYAHSTKSVVTKYFDDNSQLINLEDYIDTLTSKIAALEEQVSRIKGELKVFVVKGNSEREVNNGADIEFTVECEDYGALWGDDSQPNPDRTFDDRPVYVINDYSIRLENNAQTSSLGLLTNRSYISTTGIENSFHKEDFSQALWSSPDDELLLEEEGGVAVGQLDNQWIWATNKKTDTVKFYDDNGDNRFTNASDQITFTGADPDMPGFLNGSTSMPNKNLLNVGLKDVSTIGPLNVDAAKNVSLINNDLWFPFLNGSTVITSAGQILNNAFAATVHPVISSLNNLVDRNSEDIKIIQGKDSGTNFEEIPIKLFFKYRVYGGNADTNPTNLPGLGQAQAWTTTSSDFVDLTGVTRQLLEKSIRFFIETETDARPV
jgi:hypothetical protein